MNFVNDKVAQVVTGEAAAEIKSQFDSITAHYKKFNKNSLGFAFNSSTFREEVSVIDIGTEANNGTGYFDALARLDLPGEIGGFFIGVERNRRVIVIKGRSCSSRISPDTPNNIVIFDRYTCAFKEDEVQDEIITNNVGALYRGFVPNGMMRDRDISQALSVVSDTELFMKEVTK